MSFESLMSELQALNLSVEALAAIGAELRLRREGLDGNPLVRSLLQDVVRKINPGLLEGLNPNQELAALALIRTSFRQAIDLLESPARPPGWSYEDPVILESQGQASRLIVRSIETVAAQRPDVGSTLLQPGAFLDIGTGVGWLAIEAAHSWPALRVVGIDSWEPALSLARKNLAQSGVAERVELRLQRIEQLDDDAMFTLAWLPGPFIAAETMVVALERVYHALAPGGWLVFGLYAPPPSALGEALTNLRTVRGGGHPWTTSQVKDRLHVLGFERIETLSPTPAILFVLGQRPIMPK
ncbi:MAG TPA: class I SAM-dependent methyltransferase [Chthoniobacterales bacterium]|nr:class I SAM-dependent methyltransferase [Chthoniobacterales bacterium]